jgi:K+/H+ antiporter YhaU regulatory subunit KhtT
VLLMGTPEQVRAGKRFLAYVSGAAPADSPFEEVHMEAVAVPAGSQAAGRSVGEVAPAKRFGVQVAGLHRVGVRILNPTAGETLAVGDQLLTLGTSEQIRHFKEWLRESAEAPAAPGK